MRIFSIVLLIFLCSCIFPLHVSAQEIRPVRDDIGYCWNPDQMKRFIEHLQNIEKEEPLSHTIIAGISPHDDYLYAGRMYYPLFRVLRSKEVVIFGVTHGTVRREIGDPQNIIILDRHELWKGLAGNVGISPLREFIKSRLDSQYYIVSNKAHQLEHSIEALVPFLQYYNPSITITPIMVTVMPFERMDEISGKLSSIIAEYITTRKLIPGKDIVFLMSSDANHYGKDFNNIPFGEDDVAHTRGIEQDIRVARECLEGPVQPGKIGNLTNELKNISWCGKFSIPFGLLTTQKVMEKITGKGLVGTILRYSDTYSEGVLPLTKTGMGITASFSLKHWVGFFSAGFWAE
ncbi:MAG: AmmeMemoRadiSam system protein B [Bacteroidota bacterium]